MRIKLFCVGSLPAGSPVTLKTRAAAAFRPFSDGVLTFSDYGGFIDMAKALDDAFRSCDVIAVFASLGSYAETKELLIRALHLKTEHRFDIYSLAGAALEDFEIRSLEASVHTELPVDAVLFVPEGGLYPGFCVRSREQYIMLLPFDGEILPDLLRGRVSGFLSDITSQNGRAARPGDMHADICAVLADAGAQTAVANTPAADFVRSYGAAIEGFQRYFHFCGAAESRKGQNPKDYIIKLAIYAAKELSCPYGAAISNIFTQKTGGKKELVVYFAVAGKKTASCGSLHADDGESVDDFFSRSVNELLSLLKKLLFDENPILKRK